MSGIETLLVMKAAPQYQVADDRLFFVPKWVNGVRNHQAVVRAALALHCTDLVALRPPYVGHARAGTAMVLLVRG